MVVSTNRIGNVKTLYVGRLMWMVSRDISLVVCDFYKYIAII